VGYLITGVKDVRQSKVGDTITNQRKPASAAGRLHRPEADGLQRIYPIDGSDYADLREALDKLKLSASLQYEPETSVALGFGFRCGFLGLLHLEIITERLSREFGLDLITTAPSVTYEVTTDTGETSRSPTRASTRTAASLGLRAGRQGRHPAAEGLRRHRHGALPAAPRNAPRHGLPARTGSSCATTCRSARSSSTSSTS
jgi:translation elongation factor EF-G